MDLLNPGIEPRSPTLQADSLPAKSLQGKPNNTGVSSLSLLQQIFPTQDLNRGLLHCRQILYQLSYQRRLDWQRQKRLDCPFSKLMGIRYPTRLYLRGNSQNYAGKSFQQSLRLLPSPHMFLSWLINLCHGKPFKNQKQIKKIFFNLAPVLCYNLTE